MQSPTVVLDKIEEALLTVPSMRQRKHGKIFTVSEPVWEVLYGGCYRRNRAWAHIWRIVVWGGPDHVPNAQRVLALALAAVADVLLAIDEIEFGDGTVDVQIPGLSAVKFTHGIIEARTVHDV